MVGKPGAAQDLIQSQACSSRAARTPQALAECGFWTAIGCRRPDPKAGELVGEGGALLFVKNVGERPTTDVGTGGQRPEVARRGEVRHLRQGRAFRFGHRHVAFRANTGGEHQEKSFHYDVNTMVSAADPDKVSEIVENDLIKMYVRVTGELTYSTTIGGSTTARRSRSTATNCLVTTTDPRKATRFADHRPGQQSDRPPTP